MISILYLAAAFLGGYGLASKLKKEGSALECTAMGIGLGYLISGWITYLISYLVKVMMNSQHPKIYGNIIAIIVMLIIASLTFRPHQNIVVKEFAKEWIGLGILFIGILASMFYVFHIRNGILSSGATVFSDYAPHTAMIRSFAWHDNFPTQYPHYGGEDVKYHFMFQFFVGNLEYLGMRIDWAFNLTSAAALWGFLVLLYYFVKDLTGKKATAVITLILFFCRSSFAALEKLVNAVFSNDISGFLQNTTFIGYTEHEDWGLWNYNVFLNQRHLGFGLLIAIIVIIYFAQYLNWVEYTEKSSIKAAFAVKDAWIPQDWRTAACMGILLGSLAFWNGAVVVATLLILFGFSIASKHKLDFAIMAGITLILSFLQTGFFTEKSVGIQFLFGFLSKEKTLGGVLIYLLQLSGIYFIGVAVAIFILKGKLRIMAITFLLPVIFAFTISMTPDITVNHKYIMISVIFLNIVWAYMLTRLFSRGSIEKTIGIILIILLTITGAYDLVTIYQADKTSIDIDTGSSLTKWLKENVTESDIVLVNQDAMTETSLSGVMMYNGWPYYAWSAGYGTDKREIIANHIYTEQNAEDLNKRLKSTGIDYIVIESGSNINDSVIKQACECVFEDKNMGHKVYKTSK